VVVDIRCSIGKLLQELWRHQEIEYLLSSLRIIFFTIADDFSVTDESFYCLGCVTQFFPTSVMEDEIRTLAVSGDYPDVEKKCALQRMINWMGCKVIDNIEDWVICFIKYLMEAGKYSVISEVGQAMTDPVCIEGGAELYEERRSYMRRGELYEEGRKLIYKTGLCY